MRDLILGTVQPAPDDDKRLMKAAGIDWVRINTPFPFVDGLEGTLSEAYLRYRRTVKSYADAGIRVMGATVGPGVFRRQRDDSGTVRKVWHSSLPEWFAPLDTLEGLSSYERMCQWLGEDLKDQVRIWQVANELDINLFAGDLGPRAACELILAGARGFKTADETLIVGHNPAGAPEAMFFYGRLFGHAPARLDYCGIDGYYGSWSPGGPDIWARRIAELYELTQTPVLVNEWGFASAGGVMTEADRQAETPTCQCLRWPHTWGDGHTPEVQADYIRRTFDAFAKVKDLMMGALYFRWSDQPTCWQCGQPNCPAETAWGLVDTKGRPKASYEALKQSIRRLREL